MTLHTNCEWQKVCCHCSEFVLSLVDRWLICTKIPKERKCSVLLLWKETFRRASTPQSSTAGPLPPLLAFEDLCHMLLQTLTARGWVPSKIWISCRRLEQQLLGMREWLRMDPHAPHRGSQISTYHLSHLVSVSLQNVCPTQRLK